MFREIYIFILFIILIIFILLYNNNNNNNYDKFTIKNDYQHDNNIDTPLSNYENIINKINLQQKYKNNMSISLNPIITQNCQELNNKNDCNNYGCNWFNTFCSSIYPIYL